MSFISQKEELMNRIKAKKLRLEAQLEEAKADAKGNARKIQEELEEIEKHLKEGWDNMTEKASAKINEWLNRG